ncbi:MAG TPA: peptide-methionine (S)-S-oxide reductase MsrA [Saprospiraceae bacterium]|nr:peptide-methionine (S)-S-oxide reductase MsrA [Saprospiraceae bacterium]
MEKATVGGGCFWCIEAVLQRLKGVKKVVSGYAGGYIEDPGYREVCAGTTGHAEVVQITFDPEKISYKELIQVFMLSHDPTSLNRQGADVGTQYRSIILYHNDEQKAQAEKVIEELKPHFEQAVVTELKALETFYPAEAQHQNYYNNNPGAGYCRIVIDPKVRKLRADFSNLLAE